MAEVQTRLAIGERQTHIVVEAGGAAWTLPIGTQALVGGGPFRQHPPTPLEMEHAIETVEDAVMPLLRQLPRDTTLVTDDATAAQLLALADVKGAVLTVDDVERVFNALAAVSQGRPMASSGLPDDAGFAAYVLILREAMHHWRIVSLTVRTRQA